MDRIYSNSIIKLLIVFSGFIPIVSIFLMGCQKPPKYVKVPLSVPQGKTEGLSEAEQAIKLKLDTLVQNEVAVEYFLPMFKSAVVCFNDMDNLTFTVHLEGDKKGILVGTEEGVEHKRVLSVYSQNITNLLEIFRDNQLTDEEMYRIHRAVFGSNLHALFQQDALYKPGVAQYLNLPNFIQMELKNDKGYEFMGSKEPGRVTILNLDGQWLVFSGIQGDPDVKYAVTHKQLKEFSQLVRPPENPNEISKEEKRKKLDAIKEFLEKVTVYKRTAS